MDALKPFAWAVKDFADGWIFYTDEVRARREADTMGSPEIGALYLHPPTPPPSAPVEASTIQADPASVLPVLAHLVATGQATDQQRDELVAALTKPATPPVPVEAVAYRAEAGPGDPLHDVWTAIGRDTRLKIARQKLSAHEITLIVGHARATASHPTSPAVERLKEAAKFIDKVGGTCLALAMSGKDHPRLDDLLMEMQAEAQTLGRSVREALATFQEAGR